MPVKFSDERLHNEHRAQGRIPICLSDNAGVSIRCLRDLENPSVQLLCRISSAMKIETEDLLVVCKGEREQP